MPTNSAANPQLSCCECHAVAFVVVCMCRGLRPHVRYPVVDEAVAVAGALHRADARQASRGTPGADGVRKKNTLPGMCLWRGGGGRGGGDLVDPAPPGQTTPPPNTKEIFLWGKMKI